MKKGLIALLLVLILAFTLSLFLISYVEKSMDLRNTHGIWKCDALKITIDLNNYGNGTQEIDNENLKVQFSWAHTWSECIINYVSTDDSGITESDIIVKGKVKMKGKYTLVLTDDISNKQYTFYKVE